MRWYCTLLMLLALASPAWADAPEGGRVRLAEVLQVIAEEFEGRAVLRPAALMAGAVRAASQAIPALLEQGAPERGAASLAVRIGTSTAAWPPSRLSTPAQLAVALDELAAFVRASLPEREQPAHLEAILATGLLRALDPHSALLSAAAYGDFQSQASGRIGGLGMQLARHGHQLNVESVLAQSPAARAGVRPGDRVLQIGDRPAAHLPADEGPIRLRGRVGTLVSLLVLRPGEPAPRQLLLRRSDLRFASVESRVLADAPQARLAYVRVRSFQESTAAELREHLHRLRAEQSSLAGLVLDLRNNPGGVLEQAIRVADLLLERGAIVTLRGARIDTETVPARWYRSATAAPIVVLVNEGTASAAEIVAGALRHNHRALLMGAPTFGKHTIQSVFPLSGGNALQLTVARFTPPGGRFDAPGPVLPHVWLQPVLVAPGSGATHGLLQAAPAAALSVASRGEAPPRTVPYLARDASAPVGRHAPDATHLHEDGAEDYALAAAMHLLRLNAAQGRAALLSHAGDWARQERRRQDARIAERLGALGLDWSAGAGAAGGQAELTHASLQVRSAPEAPWQALPAGGGVPSGAQMRLTFTVRNAGALPLHRVLVVTESDAAYLDSLELPVGLLAPGGTERATLTLALPDDLPQGLERVRLRIHDGRGALHYLATLFIPQAPPPQTHLRLALVAYDDGTGGSQGNGDGRAQPGEVLALRVRLDNTGPAPAGPGRYWLAADNAPNGRQQPWHLHAWRPFGPVAAGAGSEDWLLLPLGLPSSRSGPAFTLTVTSERPAGPELAGAFSIALGRVLPRFALQAPRLALEPVQIHAGGLLRLAGSAQDAEAMGELLVLLNGRKVHYAAASTGGATRLPLALDVALEPGRNGISILARNRAGQESRRTFVLWHGRADGFPVAGVPPAGA